MDARGAADLSPPIDPVDARVISFARVAVGVWALLIAQVDPPDPARLAPYALLLLAAYTCWAVVVYNIVLVKPASFVVRISHWADVLWITALVAISNGTDSVYFFLFVFAIMVAGFSRGLLEGMALTLVSTASFGIIVWVFWNATPTFDLNRALMRPMYLLVFGTMTSMWGERELALRRRLQFLREMSRKWNPEAGHDRTTTASLHRLRQFFGAHKALLVLQHPGETTWRTFLDADEAREAGYQAQEIDAGLAAMLLALPDGRQVSYARDRKSEWGAACERIANFLDTDRFASVPYRQRDGTGGRLYLTDGRRYANDDLDFLAQCADAIAQIVENTRLGEGLAAKAARKERMHLSLGLHDTTVQPYVGLKLALEALRREAGDDNPLAGRIGQLVEMAENTIRDLRGYATELRADVSMSPQALVKTIQHHAERMERFYHVHVDVDMPEGLHLGPYVAGELYCIIAEAFSNIVRHTGSRNAFVRLTRREEGIILSIGNAVDTPATPFVPRSITERARSIGATCQVETGAYTVVNVEVPA